MLPHFFVDWSARAFHPQTRKGDASMSKSKLVHYAFATPHKYVLKSTEGKSRKTIAHRYERRRIRECLRHGDDIPE
jgi:hypothetical protein